jgi:predicted nucleic acid-binding protein
MKIVVDTNIIFSALLNSNGNIGDLLFNSDKDFEF